MAFRRAVARLFVLVLAALAATGCAAQTRIATFGPLPGGETLVTLVVSEDLGVVRRECREVRANGLILGCQTSKPVVMPGGAPVRAMKIVRFVESVPSAVTFEIDVHELCHAVAALQLLADPCHEGNGGVVQALQQGGAATIRIR